MSWRASAWAARQRTGSPAAKAVLLVLAEAANEDGLASHQYVRLVTIADRAEVSRRQTIRILSELEAAGLLQRERQFTKAGAQMPSDIRLLVTDEGVSPMTPLPREAAEGGVTHVTGGVSPMTPPECRPCHPRGDAHDTHEGDAHDTPIPSIQPSLRPSEEPSPLSPQKGEERELFDLELASSKLTEADTDRLFEIWWEHWPNKVKRKEARRLFGRTLRSGTATFDDLISGRDRYRESDKVRRGFVQNPTTWLNGEGWRDEPTPVPLPAPTRPREPWSALDQAAAGLIGDDDEPLTWRAA